MYLINKLFASVIIVITALSLTAPSALAQDAKVIKMKGTDKLKFSKTEITAKPGQEVTVKLTTVSNLPANAMSHNFVLLTAGADATNVSQTSAKFADNEYIAPEMEDKIIAYTDMAGGGETVEVTFTAPENPGEYTYVCTFPGHYLAGMKGTLTVKE
ncbi:azurin [Fodinibius salinus]|uniref:Azurin n=1 Tax=Fodinibius salinus TaxID=860790 RepID=A0A5D3YQJ5_9BACT|nr:plastocyanin/azurin family copper-binding protein [Fodinibius salinus]TYP94831.1 azurin [Fodinibius salinus]